MCGIAGFYTPTPFFSNDALFNMTRCLSHRGPDAEGFFSNDVVALGHRRLSVIDLSTAANQPMTSQNGRYVMVYNGEIYNFRELAPLLSNKGIQCRTNSDSEVILELFSLLGIEFVHHLNGMFAIAIYDIAENALYLFRDRMGVKPLYYFWDGRSFAFASELKSLQQLPQIPKVLNVPALRYFLNIGCIPAPHTIFNQCFKLEQGAYAIVTNEGLQIKPYWTLPQQIEKSVLTNEQEAKKAFSGLLISSVQYRMISDVPFGTFLSGGVDSSLITAIAQSVSDKPVNTFTIGFADTRHNEAPFAKKIAQKLQTYHHELILTEREAQNLAEELPGIYDEPYADSSAMPTLLISRLAKQQVTVILSGEGADELFWGYGTYRWASRLSNPLLQLFRTPLAGMLSKLSNRYQRIAQMLNYEQNQALPPHILSQEQYFFSQSEINRLLLLKQPDEEDIIYNSIQMDAPSARNLSPVEQQALFDLSYYLPEDLLVKMDRASMRYGLEARVPFLDYRMVKFALNLSPDLKIRGGVTKYLLKQLLYDYLPASMFDRPKSGFGVPMAKWLKTDLSHLLDQYLNKKVITHYGVVDYQVVVNLRHCFLNGQDYLYNRLWQLIVLHQWLSKNM